MSYKRILVPLDGSDASQKALAPAEQLALALAAQLVLVWVVPPFRSIAPYVDLPLKSKRVEEKQRRKAAASLRWAKTFISNGQNISKTEVLSGPVPETIIAYAEQEGIDLIVMSSHGRGRARRWRFGSVASKILRGAHCATLMVRGDLEDAAEVDFRRFLVPLDGSALAERVLAPAQTLARALAAETILFRVAPAVQQFADEEDLGAMTTHFGSQIERYLKKVRAQWPDDSNSVSVRVKAGPAAKAILDYGQEVEANLIIIAAHGATGNQKWALGGVADKVLRGARRPVLVIRTGEAAATERASAQT